MAMIQQLATNLTSSADVTMTTQDVGVLPLSNSLKKLEASVDVQNNSILELEKTLNYFMFSNHTDTIKVLEKNLNDQNSSIHSVDEKVLQLKSEYELDRNIVTKLKASVRLIEENVTANEMTLVTERIRTQLNHEQLKENITAYSIYLFAYSKRLDDFEARTNSSETSLVDHNSRIGQIELSHLSEITLNEKQKTQINELEEKINKTWIAIQGFGDGSTDRAGRGSDNNIGHFVKITAIL